MKSVILHLLLMIVLACQVTVYAQWSDDLKINSGLMHFVNMWKYDAALPLKTGGEIIALNDGRYNGIPERKFIYANRLDAKGNKIWKPEGIVVKNYKDEVMELNIVSDGTGGAIIIWINRDYSRSGTDIYAQRIDSMGNLKWDINGVKVCTYPTPTDKQFSTSNFVNNIVSDGTGGAIITWKDNRGSSGNYLIYGQRINASGNLMWNPDGIPLGLRAINEPIYYHEIVSSDDGGAIICGRNISAAQNSHDIYVQKIDKSGNLKWNNNGVPICTNSSNPLNSIRMTEDGSQGAIIYWSEGNSNTFNVHVQKINKDGIIQWPVNGVLAFSSPSYGYEKNNEYPVNNIISDGNGGAYLGFSLIKNSANGMDIFAQKISSSGTVEWGQNGIPICTERGTQIWPIIHGDGYGGLIVFWVDYRPKVGNYIQRINPSGVIQWQTNGAYLNRGFWLDVLYPDENEVWYVGSKPKIRWWTRNSYSGINIELSTDAGITWKMIRQNEPNDNATSDWVVTNTPSTKCKIRMSDADGYGIIALSDGFFTIAQPTQPSFSFTSPLGGEVWKSGTNPLISWSSIVSTSLVKFVNIDLSTNGGSNWISIFKNTPNDGKVRDWIVPNLPSMQCKLRISDPTGNYLTVSNDYFTITQPSIQILSPHEKDILIINNNFQLQWKSTAISRLVNIDLSTDAGSTWNRIRNSVTDDGSIRDWIVPNTPSSQCKIRIADISGSPSAISNGFFTISKPFIAIKVPWEGADIYGIGFTSIEWISYNISNSYVNIDLSTNGGTSWIGIGSHIKNDGAIHDWFVPDVSSTQCKIRITDSTGNLLGISNGYFTISKRPKPYFLITSPKGGEIWEVGSNPILQWNRIYLSGYVNIDLTTNGGSTWQQIIGKTPDDGQIRNWIVPNTPSTQCKIRVTDTLGSPSAVSNGFFTISKSLNKSVTQLYTDKLPEEFALNQNFPNPFNPETRINYQIPAGTSNSVFVQLKVYDIVGREITTLVNEEQSPGIYQVSFDGSSLPSGVYIYRISAGEFTSIKKMILTK